jgi:hypothetical protein
MLVVPNVRMYRTYSTNGAKEIRTPDPLNAIEVRYQLRYSPVMRIL